MSDTDVTIEVDGVSMPATKGQMLIEVTDKAGIYVPRFCYHSKLSIAANCRMCLVEVEKAPKPLPACATPVADGMKVFTRSANAIAAQKATMEFLLINHPLDCPICDQGGECELQDLAMGFGRDISRYNERKRVVRDKDLGPLVSTDMTRCIHCTRCVRFSQEIEGLQELGTIGRAEDMKISMYIEKSVDHELSGNIIDLCPVGALNNKPYRYSARAWEMLQREAVSPHDCVGTNMYAHVLRGKIKRVVPRENEAINETWIADRDRFSYEGIYSGDRLPAPMLRVDGNWTEVSWEDALAKAAESLKAADGSSVGIVSSPSATLEESHLLSRIAEHLSCSNIDHRTRCRDFTDQQNDPVMPWLGCAIQDIEQADAIAVVGSNLRREAPIIAHRVRKAALNGSAVSMVNSNEYEYHFDVADYEHGAGLVEMLAGIAVAACDTLPDSIAAVCDGVKPSAGQKRIAKSLRKAESGLLLLGNIAARHEAFSAIRALAAAIAEATGATLGSLSEGANSAGAALAGVLPHRGRGGKKRSDTGLDVIQMLDKKLDVTLLCNVEPDADILASANAVKQLADHKFVIALTPFASDDLRECADLLLPVGTFAESAGTYVNCEGRWQSFHGVANPVDEARPGWKVLRVLANLLQVPDSDYQTSEEVRDELKNLLGDIEPDNRYRGDTPIGRPNGADAPDREIDVPIYQVDAVVRRATALQLTPEAQRTRAVAED
ncbi:MAG: NADH-quinone oxidoreductase subunit NuoG [Gammaproteobacteria bacterium]|nr:NADH-quinone oxidoreductase subunit NuoG [Gammaproteobacteria bacterium]